MSGLLPKGTRIGQYELQSPLGKGGMAAVYRAYQASLDREVAIKLMADQFASDPAFAERFRREARSIARLRHPNILNIYDANEDDGKLFIVMEMIEGQTLKEEINGKPMPLEKVSKIIGQVGSALQYANDAGIIHRDVKPSNVLMDKDGRAVLSDFGIAKIATETQSQLTGTGVGVGTPDYMSPEQAMGDHLDARSDEYSLAVMTYEMLTGRPPFTGDTPIAVVMGHVSKPLPSMRQINPEIPANVEQVVNKALSKGRDDRYPGTGVFAEALQEAIKNRNSQPAVTNYDPTQVVTGFGQQQSNAYQGVQIIPEAEQLYNEARRQEQTNNFHGAFMAFSNLNSRFPNYRDVPTVLGRYEVMGYGAGQRGPNWSNQVPSGSVYTPAPNTRSYASGTSGQYTPAPSTIAPKSGGSSLPVILGAVGALAIVAVIIAIVVVAGGGGNKTPTPTVVANKTTTAAAGTPAPGTTTAAGTTAAGTATGSTVALANGVNSYPGSKKINVPPGVTKQLSLDSSPDAVVEAFTSPDDVSGVKTYFETELAKIGWKAREDLLKSNTSSTDLQQFDTVGGYVGFFQKDQKGCAVMSVPGSLAGLLGFTGIGQRDTLILVVTGNISNILANGSTTTSAAVTTKATTAPVTTKPATTSASSSGVPVYPGATEVDIPSDFQDEVDSSMSGDVTDASFKAYRTGDDGNKVKTYFNDYFKKNGWTDQSSVTESAGAEFEAMGGFFVFYQKGSSAVAIIGFPGSLSGILGFEGVGAKDTLYMIISGSNA